MSKLTVCALLLLAIILPLTGFSFEFSSPPQTVTIGNTQAPVVAPKLPNLLEPVVYHDFWFYVGQWLDNYLHYVESVTRERIGSYTSNLNWQEFIPPVYAANYNVGPGNDANTILLLHMNGTNGSTTFTDSSYGGTNSPHTVTATNSGGSGSPVIDTSQSVFGGASGYFVAANHQWLSIPDSADWNFSTNAFTIDFRVMWASLPTSGNVQDFYSQGTDGSNYIYAGVYNSSGTPVLRLIVRSGGTTIVAITQGTTLSLNTWYHIAYVRSGNSWYIFQNGTQLGSASTNTSAVADYTGVLKIGSDSGGGNFLDGWFDEYRVSNVARWTSNFTPPTCAYGEFCDVVLQSDSNLVQHNGFYVYGASPAENLALVDANARKLIGARSWSDAASLADTLLKNNKKPLSDVLSWVDSLTFKYVGVRSLSDALALTDTISRLRNTPNSLSDILAITDSLGFKFVGVRTLTDAIAFVDSLAYLRNVPKSLTGTLSLADSLGKVLIAQRTFTETLALGDSLAYLRNIPRTFTDTLALADSLARKFVGVRTLTDTLAITDALAKLRNVPSSIMDTLTWVDSLTFHYTGKRSLSDIFSFVDSVARLRNAPKPLADTLSLTDLVTRQGAFSRMIAHEYFCPVGWPAGYCGEDPNTDTGSYFPDKDNGGANRLQMFEVLHVSGVPTTIHICSTKSNSYYVGFADNGSPNANVFIQLGPFSTIAGCHSYSISSMPIVQGAMPIFTDSTIWVGFSRHYVLDPYSNTAATGACHHEVVLAGGWDDVWPNPQVNSGCAQTTDIDAIWFETNTDVGILADTLGSLRNVPKPISDVLTILDSLSRAYTGQRTNTDILSLADQLAHLVGKPLTESLIISDSLGRVFIGQRGLADSFQFIDALTGKRNVPTGLSDVLSWVDSLAFHYAGARSFSDIMVLVDSLNAQKSGQPTRSLTDTLTLADSFAKTLTGKRAFTETIQLSDVLMKSSRFQLTDVLVFLDNLAQLYRGQVNPTESVAITDVITRQYGTQASLNDVLVITENLVAVHVPFGGPTTVTITIQDLFNWNDLLGMLYVPVGVTPTGGGGFTLPVTVAPLIQIQLAAIPRIATLDYITANPMSIQTFLFNPASVLQVIFTGTNGNRAAQSVDIYYTIQQNGQPYMTTPSQQVSLNPGVPTTINSWLTITALGTYEVIPHAVAAPADPNFQTVTLPTQTITVQWYDLWMVTAIIWAIILVSLGGLGFVVVRKIREARAERKYAEENPPTD